MLKRSLALLRRSFALVSEFCYSVCSEASTQQRIMVGGVLRAVVLLTLFCGTLGQTVCPAVSGQPTCVCKPNPTNGTIDLTSLCKSKTAPSFDIKDAKGYEYTYNPCYGFNATSPCVAGTAICQKDIAIANTYYVIGTLKTEKIMINGSDIYVSYNDTGATTVYNRTAQVHLKCDANATTPTLTTTGDSVKELLYQFTLTTKCACPGGCSTETDGRTKKPVGLKPDKATNTGTDKHDIL